LAIDGVTVENQGQFSDRIRASAGRPLRFAIRRNGDQLEVTFQARQRLDEAGAAAWMIGVETGSKWQKVHPDPWEQFTDFVDRTRNTLAGLAHKAIKPKHMGGPVAIIRHTWQVAHHGTFFQALAFIVFLNFSLGVLNLFPIPVLDGGHILISGVEWAVRRPLPSKLVNAVQTGCAALLIGFMLYITFYDVRRIDAVRNLFEKAPAAPVAAAPEVTP
jgi:regulator of sigma E protease